MPLDIETLADALDALSTGDQARKKGQHVRTLRGVRGVPDGALARLLSAAWHEQRPRFPDDAVEIRNLFFGAHEDGILAIGLLAAVLPDDPEEAVELGLDLLESVDDTHTADALGWLVLGPGWLACGRPVHHLVGLASTFSRDSQRRAIAMSALAWLPEPLEGPAAAALRERTGQKVIAFSSEPGSEAVSEIVDGLLRDESPAVRKALRRVLRAWGQADPEAVTRWAASVRGGLPRILQSEVKRAQRRSERIQ